jgi:Tol biopolymer transport system component
MHTSRRVAVIIFTVFTMAASAGQSDFPLLEGPYLGQKPPGMTPEVFAPGMVSTGAIEASLTFSHDGRFMVFRRGFREDTEIFLMENRGGKWTRPVRAPFFIEDYGFGDFTFSPNKPVLHFTSNRPLQPGRTEAESSSNLWMVAYDDDGWLTPRTIADVLVTPLHESYPSVASDGTLYFFRRFDGEDRNYEMMVSEFVDGTYTEPIRMGAEINTRWEEWDPSVAPDDSLLVFCSKKPSGYGQDDLYVSFRTPAGGWTQAVNLGDQINSAESENRPFITADGKYLFYNRGNREDRDVYWVSMDAVRKLGPGSP